MKNKKHELIPAGRWEIKNFHYGHSSCACCGRKITHIFTLSNMSHQAKLQRDPQYGFPETIEIGVICGPTVFTESTAGFYDDPAMEWARQFEYFKELVDYVLLCQKNDDVWQHVPQRLRDASDEVLRTGSQDSNWWKVRHAKKHVLRTNRALARDGGAFCRRNAAKRIYKLDKVLLDVGAIKGSCNAPVQRK